MRMVFRVAWYAAFALAGAVIPGPATYAATGLVVGKAAVNSDTVIAANVGAEAGIFRKHGLDVKIVDFTGGSKMVQAMTAGSLDIGVGSGTQMAFIAKGAPMKAVCESARTLPFIAIGLPWNSPIKSLAELKSKKIGISSAGSLTDWLARELVRHEGWGPNDITEVAIGNASAGIIAAFHDNLVDADIGDTSLFLTLEQRKIGKLLEPVSDYVGPIASGALFASDKLIAGNPGALRSFLAAWVETLHFIRTDKPETVRIESKVTGFPADVMAKDYDLTVGMFTKDCRFDAESLANLKRSFVDLKLLAKPPQNMASLYTEAYLPK
ncbi:MAG: ABC transporter substrate-binding protein [Stellaceae bacterium]